LWQFELLSQKLPWHTVPLGPGESVMKLASANSA
jgi:hypothetical protein